MLSDKKGCSSGQQQQLSCSPPAFQVSVRADRVLQRVGMLDPKLERSFQDHVEHRLGALLQLLRRCDVGAQRGPSYEQRFLRKLDQVQGWHRAARATVE